MKAEFGNTYQIELIALESEHEGKVEGTWVDCDCDCPRCEAEYLACGVCDAEVFDDEDQCENGHSIMPEDVVRRIKFLKQKLK